MKSGAVLAVALVATAAAALIYNGGDKPAPVSAEAPAPPGRADPHAGVPGAPPLDPASGHPGGSLPPGYGALPPGHPPIDGPAAGDPHGGLPPGHPPVGGEPSAVTVKPLEGGVTVSQIVREAGSLAGKRVRLAAKVVKSTPNVLGRTWLHVQDGSGEASRGDHNLVVTTEEVVPVGSVIVLEGTVVRDKDLGSGYRYDVLLEDATIGPLGDGRAAAGD
jgi:hypothetical protein